MDASWVFRARSPETGQQQLAKLPLPCTWRNMGRNKCHRQALTHQNLGSLLRRTAVKPSCHACRQSEPRRVVAAGDGLGFEGDKIKTAEIRGGKALATARTENLGPRTPYGQQNAPAVMGRKRFSSIAAEKRKRRGKKRSPALVSCAASAQMGESADLARG